MIIAKGDLFYWFVYLFIGSQAAEVVVISNSTTLRTGETALLACVSFGEPDVEISWSFNGAPVVNTSLVTIYEEGVVQGERIFKQSFLQICSLAETDDGGYTCIASDGFTTDNATTQLTVTRKFINVLFLLLNFFSFFFGSQQVLFVDDNSKRRFFFIDLFICL